MTIARVLIASAAIVTTVTATDVRVLRVTTPADDGREGSLRWAIVSSNATPEPERIEIALGDSDRTITLKSALPPLEGPVTLVGAAWERTGDYVVIDASGYIASGGPERCPGATPGQFGANVRTMTLPGLQIVDTTDVEVTGVEIRGFCIGMLVNRAKNAFIHDNRRPCPRCESSLPARLARRGRCAMRILSARDDSQRLRPSSRTQKSR